LSNLFINFSKVVCWVFFGVLFLFVCFGRCCFVDNRGGGRREGGWRLRLRDRPRRVRLSLGSSLPAGRTDPPRGGSAPSEAPPRQGTGRGDEHRPGGEGGGGSSPPAIVEPPRSEQPLKTSAESPG